MHGRTYQKYYFKITIFCIKQNLLVQSKIKNKIKNQQELNIERNSFFFKKKPLSKNSFAKLVVQVMRPRQTDRKEHKGNHKTIFLKQCRMIKITK